MESILPSFYAGIWHVFNWPNYELLLFLMVVAVVCSFKDWKQLFIISVFFTSSLNIGFLITWFNLFVPPSYLVYFVQAAVIFVLSVFNFTNAGKTISGKFRIILAVLLGLFNGISIQKSTVTNAFDGNVWVDFPSFLLGVEAGQLAAFVLFLAISWLVANAFNTPKKDWMLILSGAVMGVSILKLLDSLF